MRSTSEKSAGNGRQQPTWRMRVKFTASQAVEADLISADIQTDWQQATVTYACVLKDCFSSLVLQIQVKMKTGIDKKTINETTLLLASYIYIYCTLPMQLQ